MKVKYVEQFVDRLGNIRFYYRVYPGPRTPLRGPLDSPEFWADYVAAKNVTVNVDTDTTLPETQTIRWLCTKYYSTAEYKSLGTGTRKGRKSSLERFCKKHGGKGYKNIKTPHFRAIRDKMTDRPEAWNNLRKALRQVFKYAVEYNHLETSPMNDVPKLAPINKDGWHTWTKEEIKQFLNTHPIGSKARLALALLLFTGQRRGDIIHLGRQHIKDGWVQIRQQKTGKALDIPVSKELRRTIDATPTGDLNFLVTEYGKPWSNAGFGNKFRDWCDAAGLPHCSAHGLRKAAAAELAELGCTAHEIMAITGHESIQEVERYTKAAEQKRMAKSAMRKLEGQN